MSILRGTLIAESLKVGAVVGGVALAVSKIRRDDVGDVAAGQPRTWTLVEFEGSSEDADLLARLLEGSLLPTGGWYCDFHTDAETFVVFAGATYRYPRGDKLGRAKALEHARSAGVPSGQLDWPV